MFSTTIRLAAFAGLAAVFLLFSAVTPGRADQAGRIEPSREVRESIQSLEPMPGMSYYGIGQRSSPRAILGVSGDFELQSSLWWKFDLAGTHGKVIKRSFADVARICATNPQGYTIVDGSGKKVGVWYTDRYDPSITLRDDGTMTVIIPANQYWSGEEF